MEPTSGPDNETMLGTLFDQGAIALIRGQLFDKPPDPVIGRTDFDRVEGMLLGIAIGDSLGNTTEGMTPEAREDEYGTITDYLPGRYGSGVPSDDTQLAFWSLEQMLHDGRIEPELISARFTKDRIFGIGQAVSEFLLNKSRGRAWQHCGAKSAGNGALMRIAPVVLPHLRSATPDLWVDTALLSMVTHNDSASISSSLAFVNILWNLLGMEDAPPPEWWAKTYIDTTRDLEIYEEYQPRGGSFLGFQGPLWQFVQDYVPSAFGQGLSVRDACNSWYSGAYLFETVPSVLYILMTYGDDPEQAIIAAVNETKDNDTIAAIVGAAVGALHGKSALPERWLTGLLGRTKASDDGYVFELINRSKRTFWDIPSHPLVGRNRYLEG